MTEAQTSPEQNHAETKNKIYHFGEVDAVIPLRNLSDNTYREMLEVSSMAQKDDFSRLEEAGGMRSGEGRFFLMPASEPGGSKVFVKQRRLSDEKTDPTLQNLQELRDIPKDIISEQDSSELRALNAMHSVLNELNVSPSVEELISGPKFQELARKLGFSSLDVSMPKFAAVNRNSHRKYVAYEAVPNAITTFELRARIRSNDESVTENEKEVCRQQLDRLMELTKGLHSLLVENGTVPFDIHDTQLLYDDLAGEVHIIDIEGWHQKA